jgi:hypothetical protein
MIAFLEAAFRELREAAGVAAESKPPAKRPRVGKAKPAVPEWVGEVPAADEELEDAPIVAEEELEPVS